MRQGCRGEFQRETIIRKRGEERGVKKDIPIILAGPFHEEASSSVYDDGGDVRAQLCAHSSSISDPWQLGRDNALHILARVVVFCFMFCHGDAQTFALVCSSGAQKSGLHTDRQKRFPSSSLKYLRSHHGSCV